MAEAEAEVGLSASPALQEEAGPPEADAFLKYVCAAHELLLEIS